MNGMTNINVIGGSGFIGTRLVSRLIKNSEISVKIIDKAPSKKFPELTRVGDVRSVQELQECISEQSIIVNLAAEHRDDVRPVSLYSDVNIQGAENICEVAREKNVSIIIFTSTVAVYGFAPIGTDETGNIAPFNEYGRTKYEAESIFRAWQSEAADERLLVIIRPTVVFGEKNRGNVYNLLNQIASGRFVMVGNGENRKSMAYVENVTAFIEFSMKFEPGVHVYNFVDKPDFTMNSLVARVRKILGRPARLGMRLPFFPGYMIGKVFDLVARVSGKNLAISSIRVKKFCADSVYGTSISNTGFVSPVPLENALEQTVRYEFMESHDGEDVFYTE